MFTGAAAVPGGGEGDMKGIVHSRRERDVAAMALLFRAFGERPGIKRHT